MNTPVLGVTMGDPAGVGPEIIARACAEPAVRTACRPVVIGAAATMTEVLGLVGSPLALHAVTNVKECRWGEGTLEVLDLGNVDMATLPRCRVSAAAGRAAYEYIETAVALARTGAIDAIVTAPINKEALAAAGLTHSGHTEILATLSGTRDFAMLLMGESLRPTHATTHVSLIMAANISRPGFFALFASVNSWIISTFSLRAYSRNSKSCASMDIIWWSSSSVDFLA